MARVTLTLTNPSRGASYEIKWDASGRFEFVGLAIRRVPEWKQRFRALRRSKETIAISSTNVVDRRFTLQLGEVHGDNLDHRSAGGGTGRVRDAARDTTPLAVVTERQQDRDQLQGRARRSRAATSRRP